VNRKLIYRSRAFPAVALASLCTILVADPQPPALAAELLPAKQQFRQEMASHLRIPGSNIQLLDITAEGSTRCFASGKWFVCKENAFVVDETLTPFTDGEFTFFGATGEPTKVSVPWREVIQVIRLSQSNLVVSANSILSVNRSDQAVVPWERSSLIRQVAVSPAGKLYVASNTGLWEQSSSGWQRVLAKDRVGRLWTDGDVLGVALDSRSGLWFASRAGAACRTADGWKFYEGKDGVPWTDFSGIAAGPQGEVWFATHLGAIRYDKGDWHYRQGPLWLAGDDIKQVAVNRDGVAWFATAAGVTRLEFRPMTLAAKAESYEDEINRFIKRTPYGYVSEAALKKPGDRSSADPQDSDNDGLWTSMYGAGECFAYAATAHQKSKERAKGAFEALRFLQKVTEGGIPAPPKGFIARTIRPIDWPDPNIGRLAGDRAAQKSDKLWKAYEPRWPKSADGKWFWKSDTSSDELDGHFFFYPLYYEFCAQDESERERVRDVVRGITDHLIDHDFMLIDHDGAPTRWGVYSPKLLNHDPFWWAERGLKSLSILSYLSAAAYVTGDEKYTAAARKLIDEHGYAQNAMFPKVQHGPGSGNQSDDEMAFMCFYTLLRYSKDEPLKSLARYSYYRYWVNEEPEMNPFFNFAYASQNLAASGSSPWGEFPLKPWANWHEDAMATLYGFPLDRLNWPQHNSHRLDLQRLTPVKSVDISDPDRTNRRGFRMNGKVLPVENRHFNHWNTDPWALDYGGNGNELASGTVFLLPYYMGLYCGYIEKP
jgi:hypothetical protein